MFLTQTEAKRTFLTLCRDVAKGEERAYVRDKAGEAFLTLDHAPLNLGDPAVPVSAQFFKDNFGRCCSLVKTGVCFELTLKGFNRTVVARRHTAYQDPLDGVLEKWLEIVMSCRDTSDGGPETAREHVADNAMGDMAPDEMARLFREHDRKFGKSAGIGTGAIRASIIKAVLGRPLLGPKPLAAGERLDAISEAGDV